MRSTTPPDSPGGLDEVLAHLDYPLVAICLRLLRAEIWSPAGQGKLARATARPIPTGIHAEQVVAAHAHLLLGGDNTRLHEQVIEAGAVLRESRRRSPSCRLPF